MTELLDRREAEYNRRTRAHTEKQIVLCNLIAVAEHEDRPQTWNYLFHWIESKAGARDPALGYKGDNDWAYAQIPEHAKDLYDDRKEWNHK
jgi:hypothetical protein